MWIQSKESLTRKLKEQNLNTPLVLKLRPLRIQNMKYHA